MVGLARDDGAVSRQPQSLAPRTLAPRNHSPCTKEHLKVFKLVPLVLITILDGKEWGGGGRHHHSHSCQKGTEAQSLECHLGQLTHCPPQGKVITDLQCFSKCGAGTGSLLPAGERVKMQIPAQEYCESNP